MPKLLPTSDVIAGRPARGIKRLASLIRIVGLKKLITNTAG